MSAVIRAAHAAALLDATDELMRCIHAVDEGLDPLIAIAEMRVAAVLVETHVRALLQSVPSGASHRRRRAPTGDVQCIACGEPFASAEGHPTVALGPCCWRRGA